MRVGFTGTQDGMTEAQDEALDAWLLSHDDIAWFHHGDCIGSDKQAHDAALGNGINIAIHPPSDSSKRAWCMGAREVRDPKPYLDRNHDIVDECDVLIATPKTFIEVLRSGTWATIRYALKRGKPVTIIWPNGSVYSEGGLAVKRKGG